MLGLFCVLLPVYFIVFGWLRFQLTFNEYHLLAGLVADILGHLHETLTMLLDCILSVEA